MLLLVLGAHAGNLEAQNLEATLPSEYVQEGIDKMVHCLAGIFVSPIYALIYSIIYVEFDYGSFEFSHFLSNFGKFLVENLKNQCLDWVPGI